MPATMPKRPLPRKTSRWPRTCGGHRLTTPAVDFSLCTRSDTRTIPRRGIETRGGVSLYYGYATVALRDESLSPRALRDDGQLDTRDDRLGSVRCVESRSRDSA